MAAFVCMAVGLMREDDGLCRERGGYGVGLGDVDSVGA